MRADEEWEDRTRRGSAELIHSSIWVNDGQLFLVKVCSRGALAASQKSSNATVTEKKGQWYITNSFFTTPNIVVIKQIMSHGSVYHGFTFTHKNHQWITHRYICRSRYYIYIYKKKFNRQMDQAFRNEFIRNTEKQENVIILLVAWNIVFGWSIFHLVVPYNRLHLSHRWINECNTMNSQKINK